MYSNTLSHYYDKLMGDYSSIATTTKKLVTTYTPPASHVLELGCGTGNMLHALKKDFLLSGLDNSQGMLALARKKVPSARLYFSDMRTFSIQQTFSTVFCVFDTMNHLTTFPQWKQCFARVNKYLMKDGIFIFDMNTTKRLETLAVMPPFVTKLDKDTLACVKVHKEKKRLYGVKFQIFQNIHDRPRCIEEIVYETAVDVDLVKESLQRYFSIEKMVDPIRKRITSKTGRIFFVCRKKF